MLTTQRRGVFDFPYAGLNEFRITEMRARARAVPQSVWKLNQGVSVGGQTIMGIKHLHELRYQSAEELCERMSIWPFETAWSIPTSRSIVLAEIFPSVLPLQNHGGPRDKDQVLTCVNHAASLDSQGQLAGRFASPADLTPAQLERVEVEEGWILFV